MNIHIVCPRCGCGWDDIIVRDKRSDNMRTETVLELDSVKRIQRAETGSGSINLVEIDGAYFIITVSREQPRGAFCKVVPKETAGLLFDQAVSGFPGQEKKKT
jgi:hypothetical protein